MTWLERLRRLWHETTAAPAFGLPSAPRRLLRIQLGPALLLALPAQLLILWYSWQVLVLHARTASGTGVSEPLGRELFQLYAHDVIRRDLRLLNQDPRPSARLSTIALRFGNAELDRLDHAAPGEGSGEYVRGTLEFRGDSYQVRARYRGQKHWHYRYPQKSWKIRLDSPGRLLGHETLLLVNSPEPEPLMEPVLLEIAKAQGLLVPSLAPVQVVLNGAPLGVYFLEAPADEAVLRAADRFPWNLYSGNGAPIDPTTGASSLFQGAQFWTKAAGPVGQDEDVAELERLLDVIAHAGSRSFADFARRHVDLEAFARLAALDVVFGIDQHNYDENQKLYFDPYKGKFEPIVWNLRGADHEPQLELAPSPLLLRLSDLPEYTQRRNELIWSLLAGDARPSRVRERLRRWDALVGGALEHDRFWDAANLLPRLSPYYSELVRPMDRERQLAARDLTLARLEERQSFLRRALDHQDVSARLRPHAAHAGSEGFAELEIGVSGHAALQLESLRVNDPGCSEAPLRVRRASSVGIEPWRGFEAGAPVRLDDVLVPGTLRAPRPADAQRGWVRLVPVEQSYVFQLTSRCVPESLQLRAKNAISGRVVEMTVGASSEPRKSFEVCSDAAALAIGSRSVHPDCLALPAAKSLALGPGVVPVPRTLEFDRATTVTIAPGTRFEMAPDASMIFRGRVEARSSLAHAITWVGSNWGVVALQGRGTTGSVLSGIRIEGATRKRRELLQYPAALNVHDTENVTIEAARIAPGASGEDGVHLAYVRGAVLRDVQVSGAPADGVDAEFCTLELERLLIEEAGDDALDLMGSTVHLRGGSFAGCGGNGVSAGERTRAALTALEIGGCARGLLAKNGSSVHVTSVRVSGAEVGARVEQRSEWYENESELLGSKFKLASVRRAFELIGKPRVEVVPELLAQREQGP